MPTHGEHWLLSVLASGEGGSGLIGLSCASKTGPAGQPQQGCSFVSLGREEGCLGSVGSRLPAQTPSLFCPHWIQRCTCLACSWREATANGRLGPLKNQPSPSCSVCPTSKALMHRGPRSNMNDWLPWPPTPTSPHSGPPTFSSDPHRSPVALVLRKARCIGLVSLTDGQAGLL